jgi:hypothetical protein
MSDSEMVTRQRGHGISMGVVPSKGDSKVLIVKV